jgi:hypothetical protein
MHREVKQKNKPIIIQNLTQQSSIEYQQWESACLASMRSRVQIPVPQKKEKHLTT